MNNTILTSKNSYEIVGDFSSAAFVIVATLISKESKVIIKNVGLNPSRCGLLEILVLMGANIEIKNKIAIIQGPSKLTGAEVMATDLRASVSLVLAGLAADNRTIIVIPNFSVGAAYQKIFSNALSSKFNSVNIVEKHHSKKQDSPSGTAFDLANSLPPELTSHDLEGKYSDVNKINNKNIYSLRGDEYLAEQTVNFVNEFESFHLDHNVSDRKAYLYGMKIVLDQYSEMEGFNFGLENILADQITI